MRKLGILDKKRNQTVIACEYKIDRNSIKLKLHKLHKFSNLNYIYHYRRVFFFLFKSKHPVINWGNRSSSSDIFFWFSLIPFLSFFCGGGVLKFVKRISDILLFDIRTV